MPTYYSSARHSYSQPHISYSSGYNSLSRRDHYLSDSQDSFSRHATPHRSSGRQLVEVAPPPYRLYDYGDDRRPTQSSGSREPRGNLYARDFYEPRTYGYRSESNYYDAPRFSRQADDFYRRDGAYVRDYTRRDEASYYRPREVKSRFTPEHRRVKDWGFSTAYGRELDNFSREFPSLRRVGGHLGKYAAKTTGHVARRAYDASGAAILLGPTEAAFEGLGYLVVTGLEKTFQRR